jgi:TonB-dependent starch-binding outer membrane protein SusC
MRLMARPFAIAGLAVAMGTPTVHGMQDHASLDILMLPARVDVVQASVPEALGKLRESSGVAIAFSPSLLPPGVLVTCRCVEVSLGDALTRILDQTGFGFIVIRGQVIVERANGEPWDPGAYLDDSEVLRGRVINRRTNLPLGGAQVFLPGTSLGAITDEQGRFALFPGPNSGRSIESRLIGYAEVSRSLLPEDGGRIEIHMVERPFEFDAIVVTGSAGTTRRREVGYSISAIEADQVADPVVSTDQILQSRAVGVTVTPTGAAMGGGAQIRLRGNVSPWLSNQPLIYIDGVRQSSDSYTSQLIEGGPTHLQGPPASPLNDINPRDIARIEVIKGAAATTLYGSEAASGVIQIFTKRGREGTPAYTYQMDNFLTRVRPFGSEKRPFLNMEPLLRTGHTQVHSLSVSGGTPRVGYFASGLLQDGRGVLRGSEEFRGSVRANLTFDLSDRMQLVWNNAYSRNETSGPQTGGTLYGLEFNAFRAPNNLIGSDDPDDLRALLEARVTQFNQRVGVGLTATFAQSASLTHRLTVGMDRMKTDLRQLAPYGYVLAADGFVGTKLWQSGTQTLDYELDFLPSRLRKAGVALSMGMQLRDRTERSQDAFGYGFSGPGDREVSQTQEARFHGEEFQTVTGGIYAQAAAGFRERYFFTLGVRLDGSSAFGANLGLQPYPKLSGSWVVSEESFWDPDWGQLRFRGAFGYAGRAPSAFDASRAWRSHEVASGRAFLPHTVGNPDLAPERTRELDLGVESSFLQDRLGIAFTYYRQATTGALFPVQQTPSRGFPGTQLGNIGSLTNRGVELELRASVIERRDLEWHVGLNVATNQSRILDLGGDEHFDFVVGMPAPVVRGTRVLNPGEFAAPIFEVNALHGPNQPTRTIGVSSSVALFKGVTLSARAEHQGGHYIRDGASSGMASRGAGAAACDDNAYKIVPFDAFPDHPNLSGLTALERARCYGQRGGADFRIWIYPADFLKLRDVTLLVPLDFAVGGTRTATFIASLGNILLWTHPDFPSFDPESAMDMNALDRHINTLTPAPARLSLSLRLGF